MGDALFRMRRYEQEIESLNTSLQSSREVLAIAPDYAGILFRMERFEIDLDLKRHRPGSMPCATAHRCGDTRGN